MPVIAPAVHQWRRQKSGNLTATYQQIVGGLCWRRFRDVEEQIVDPREHAFSLSDRLFARYAVAQGDFSIESGAVAGERLLAANNPPTAIFCFNDEMAMGALEMAKRRSMRVPNDLSVIGFDDIRFARCIDPPLTTISQPMRAIGEGTVRLLLDIIGGRTTPPESVTLPHTLVVRESTCPPAR